MRTGMNNSFIEHSAVFHQLFQNYPQAIALMDKSERIVKVNNAFADMFGYLPEEVEGRFINNLVVPDEYQQEAEIFTEKTLKGKKFKEKTVRQDRDGNLLDVMITGCPVLFNGKPVGIYGIYDDISEKIARKKRIKKLSIYDHSTGLYRKNYFKKEMTKYDSQKHYPLSIFVIDVNGLKFVNDVFGHHKGDQLLKKVANVIKGLIPEKGIMARWGGDEFTILMPDTGQKEAEQVKKFLEESCLKQKIDKIKISIALGYSTKVLPEQNIKRVFKQAEDKMYDDKIIKNRRRDTIRFSFLNDIFKEKVKSEINHIKKISKLSLALGKKLNLNDRDMIKLKDLSIFYDVGKVRLPDNIIAGQDRLAELSGEEYEMYKDHTRIGYQIIRNSHMFSNIADDVLYHHERWDGKGYPHGLKGDEIPLLSRIIAIITDYCCQGKEKGREKIINGKGRKYDPEFVDIFINEIVS